jgi:Uma2 family endonuclease
MPLLSQIKDQCGLLLHDVSWKKYDALLHALDDRHLRLTYDRGTLEIMALSPEHERSKVVLRRLVDVLSEELDVEIGGLGSTTCRKEDKGRGLEPDECFYIANFPKIRGKKRLNLKKDPPPDLAMEVDVTHSSLDRMDIYAALRVPELWRFDGKALHIYQWHPKGYKEVNRSPAFPLATAADLTSFLKIGLDKGDNFMVKAFRAWIREQLKGNGAER